MERAPYVALAVGILTALVAGIAIAEGMVLSVDTAPVAMVAGVLVGAILGGLTLVALADRSTPDVARHVATGLLLFGAIGLVIFLGASTANVSNSTSLVVGVVVGGIVGFGVFYYLRENAQRQVTAI
jgi:ABC-type Mn2+/Zn2+ transport system permease subunit